MPSSPVYTENIIYNTTLLGRIEYVGISINFGVKFLMKI